MYIGGAVNGPEVGEEYAFDDVAIGSLLGNSVFYDPLKQVVLRPKVGFLECIAFVNLNKAHTGLSDQSSPSSFMLALRSFISGRKNFMPWEIVFCGLFK